MANIFGKIAADTLGISDIGKIISPSDFDKVDGDDYILHEDNEKIFFVIKSKSDEYVFTNYGLLHVDGANATSKKRTVYRYEFIENNVKNVYIETAGHIDLDIEIKFTLNENKFSIDVDKNQIEQLKDLYKALYEIGKIQKLNKIHLENSKESLENTKEVFSKVAHEIVNANDFIDAYKEIANFNQNWHLENFETYNRRDFSEVFNKYIQN